MSKIGRLGKKLAVLLFFSFFLGVSSGMIGGRIAVPMAEEETESTTRTATESEDWGFNSQEKFVVFVCCFFSVAFCLVVGLWGDPNDRLKDRYKRARKQQKQKEKRLKEKAEREAKRAAAEAKYQEELAQYEAELKVYEEEKAAKAAAKAAKKAEKDAKKK